MTEKDLQSRILLKLGSHHDIRLFRNQVGFGFVGNVINRGAGSVTLGNARPVTMGLMPGSGDLIGWRSLHVTPDMVGRNIAAFLSVEVKLTSGHLQENQVIWMERVQLAGGCAIVARTTDSIDQVLSWKP